MYSTDNMRGLTESSSSTASPATNGTAAGPVALSMSAAWDVDNLAALDSMVVGVSLLTIIGAGFLVNTNRIRNVPESGIAMVLGCIIGIVALSIDHLRGATEEERVLMFQPDIFFYLLLPPVVFEAGFSADQRIFVNNLGAILSFAVIGTFVSTVVVAEGLYMLGFSNKLECYLFGSLMSATDPVATIALFGSQRFTNGNSDAIFHCLVFGESLLNDAVAVVLFSAFERRFQSSQHDIPNAFSLVMEFVHVSFGSLLIGLAAGLLCSWCFRRVHPLLHQFPAYEVSSTFFVAYLSYAFSQYLDYSGITALFFCGIVLSKYNWYNLSDVGKISSKVSFRTLSMICESLVFCYLGVLSIFSISTTSYHWNFPMIIASLILIAVGRAMHVFPLTKMLNLVRSEPISLNAQIMMWFSGLRGAVAAALALRLPSIGCSCAGSFVTTAIAIVALTTLVLGSALETIARRLELFETDTPSVHTVMEDLDDGKPGLRVSLLARGRAFPRGLYQRFARFDKDVLQQSFGGKYCGISDIDSMRATELQEDFAVEDEYIPCSSRSVIFE